MYNMQPHDYYQGSWVAKSFYSPQAPTPYYSMNTQSDTFVMCHHPWSLPTFLSIFSLALLTTSYPYMLTLLRVMVLASVLFQSFLVCDLLQFLASLWLSDVHNVLFSTAPLCSCRHISMASAPELIHLISGLPFSATFYFPRIIVFSKKTLPCHDGLEEEQLQFVIFVKCFKLKSKTHSFVFLEVQSIHRAFLQHHISSECNFFSYQPF